MPNLLGRYHVCSASQFIGLAGELTGLAGKLIGLAGETDL